MGFLDGIMTLFALSSVPWIAPGIVISLVTSFGFGLFGEMILGYAVPFLFNWIINFASDFTYYYMNCSGTRTAGMTTLAMTSIVPAIITFIFAFALNVIPVLKLPLTIFSFIGPIFGISWILELIITLIGNYVISAPVYLASRAGFLSSSCKKDKDDEEK